MHVLVVDDDEEIRRLLERYLVTQGFRVSLAATAREAEACLAEEHVSLVVLDVMLPDASGLDLCRTLSARSGVPIIMLTALREDLDRIVGLEIGADDYLGKPFNPRELVARIRAVLRRAGDPPPEPAAAPKVYRFAGFVADPSARSVVGPDLTEIELTVGEFDLLLVFLERPGQLLSRDDLVQITQGRERAVHDRSIDMLISRLRRKLGERVSFQILKTQRNGGYQLAVQVSVENRA